MYRPAPGLITLEVTEEALPLPVSSHALAAMVERVHRLAVSLAGGGAGVATRALAGWAPKIGYGEVKCHPERGLVGWDPESEQARSADARFGPAPAEAISQRWSRARERRPELARVSHPLCWFRVRLPEAGAACELVAQLGKLQLPWIRRVYEQPAPGLDPATTHWPDSGGLSSGSLRFKQAAPLGVGRAAVDGVLGVDGARVRLGEIEQGWWLQERALGEQILKHPDFGGRRVTVVNHVPPVEPVRHGTMVLGVLVSQLQDGTEYGCHGMTSALEEVILGSTRIPPPNGGLEADLDGDGVPDFQEDDTANAIFSVLAHLSPGDVILLERTARVFVTPQGGSNPKPTDGPIEADPGVHAAICCATAGGMIVVEAAGNGSPGRLLDQATRPGGELLFSADRPDSGAILVAAGQLIEAPAGGTSAAPAAPVQWGRLTRSNYGARIDCFADGKGVRSDSTLTSTANTAEDPEVLATITDGFSDTSAASAVIAGVAIAVQGVYRANHGGASLSPEAMRELLRDSSLGTPGPGNLGVMPDLVRLIARLTAV